MKADLLKRLFRTLETQSWSDFVAIGRAIVREERKKGHSQVADELAGILDAGEKASPVITRPVQQAPQLFEIPRNRRHDVPLTVEVPRESLRHHMVLRPETEQRIARIEKEFAARQRLSRYGLKNRSKILLYGKPGCGKTMAAERIAFTTGLPMKKVRFDALFSSFFGETARNLSAVFDSATAKPCLLLLDECDFIARSRTHQNDVGEAPRIVNALMQLLDDFQSEGLLVATTNLYSVLDNALFRRFDDAIEMPLPDRDEIASLLRMSLSAMTLADNIQWRRIEERLLGASASTVVTVATSAARESVMSNARSVEQRHFDIALSEVLVEEET